MKQEELEKINLTRCRVAYFLSIIVMWSTFIGVVIKLVAPSTAEDPYEGIKAFRYFTVLSNLISVLGITLSIPYEIDGLRNHNYHLPQWIVSVIYCGVSGVTLTFLIALFFLAPATSFQEVFFQKANFFLHLVSPVISIFLFIYIFDSHFINFKKSLAILNPVIIYGFVYWIEVFVIGEENGGWIDIYYTNVYFPYWILIIIVPLLYLGISNVLRYFHNRVHKKRKKQFEDYYMNCEEYDCEDITHALFKLADRDKKRDRGGEIIVPRRIITILEQRYKSGMSIEELSVIYLKHYIN